MSEKAQMCHYRLLKTVDDHLLDDDLSRLKVYCKFWIKPAKLQKITTTRDLLDQLETQRVIKVGHYDNLIQLLKEHQLYDLKEMVEELATKIARLVGPPENEGPIGDAPVVPSGVQLTGTSNDSQHIRTYPCEKRGLVLVINNMKFVDQPKKFREGSQEDVESIKDLFENELKGFYDKVIVKDDCTLADMQTTFQSCRDQLCRAQLGSGNYDQFICFILSHGDQEGIETTDGKHIMQKEIEGYFNARAVKVMADRPKVFVYQACRGNKLQECIRADSSSEGASVTASGDTALPVYVPIDANILTAYATTEDRKAFRNIHTGSWFIQRMCEVFKGHYKQHDVLSMLTEVIHEVSCHRGGDMIQLPVVTTKLTKKMFLKYK